MPDKSLGQHWLTDRLILASIAEAAELSKSDTVLEIGPGLGTLTSVLLRQSDRVVAVEFDATLAAKLPGQFPGTNLSVFHEDILSYDTSKLPPGYKVVANVPYYITSKIVEKLMTASNKPSLTVLLVQKEVAERIAARPGDMSLLALGAQVYAEASLGVEVPREHFSPPPKVDSQVVILRTRAEPLVADHEQKAFWRAAHAGFASKRKKLRSSLSAGLAISKQDAEQLMTRVGVNPDLRAESLSVEDWLAISRLS